MLTLDVFKLQSRALGFRGGDVGEARLGRCRRVEWLTMTHYLLYESSRYKREPEELRLSTVAISLRRRHDVKSNSNTYGNYVEISITQVLTQYVKCIAIVIVVYHIS
jgi:hypothetical protein